MTCKSRWRSQVRLIIFGALSLLTLLFSANSALSQHRIELTPSISVSETYDDNIYMNSSDEVSDYLTAVSPGLSLNILSQKMEFELAYAPTFVWYADEKENDTVRHAGTLTFGRDLTQHLRFNLTDAYIFTEEPLAESVEVEGVSVSGTPHERYEYHMNTGSVSLDYLFGAENILTAGYRHALLDNEDKVLDDSSIPDDRTLQTPFATLEYWFNVKHGMELNYEFVIADFNRKDDFEPGDDYTGHMAEIRYLYRFTPHTTGSAGYNFITRDFDGEEEDYDIHEGSIGLEHAFSPDLSVSLTGGYLVQKNEVSDDENDYTYGASLVKTFTRGSFTAGGSSGVDENVLDAAGRGLTRFWSANARLEYQFLEPFRGYAGGYYRRNKDEERREWKTWRTNFGLTWEFLRWYSISLDYAHDVREDEVDTDDYTVNRIALILTASKPHRW